MEIYTRPDKDTLEESLKLQGDLAAVSDQNRYNREALAGLFEQEREGIQKVEI